MRSSKPRRQQ